MSFYHNDSRPDETTPRAHHELSAIEIGVIVATVTSFFVLIIAVFLYRNRKAKKALARQHDTELGHFHSDDKDDPSRNGALPPTRDSDLPEPLSPAEPKPVRLSNNKPISQLFYKPRMFLKTNRDLPVANVNNRTRFG